MRRDADWSELDRSKTDYWRARKKKLGAVEGVRIADELRRQVQALRPDWPSPAERAADLDTHVRIARMLRVSPPAVTE